MQVLVANRSVMYYKPNATDRSQRRMLVAVSPTSRCVSSQTGSRYGPTYAPEILQSVQA